MKALLAVTVMALSSLLTHAAEAPAPTPKEWLKLNVTGPLQLAQEEDGSLSCRIPISPGKDLAGATDFAPYEAILGEVVFNDGRTEGLVERFKVDLKPASPAANGSRGATKAALVVKVAHARLIQPGSYTLGIDIQSKSPPANQVQALTLTVVRPAPEIAAVGTISVLQTWTIFCKSDPQSSGLHLKEKSGKASVTGIEFIDERDRGQGPVPHNGTLSLALCQQELPAGKSAQATAMPQGSYPLGETSGIISVASPDLKVALPVAYKVRVRRDPILIILIIALGSLTGWITRVWAKRKTEQAGAAKAFAEVKSAVNEQFTKATDAKLTEEIRDILEKLDTAQTTGQVETLIAAATTAKTSLDATLNAFRLRHTAVSAKVATYHLVLSPQRNLPGDVATAFEKARSALSEISSLVQRNNITDAEGNLVTTTAFQQLDLKCQEWRSAVCAGLDVLIKKLPRSANIPFTPEPQAALWKQRYAIPDGPTPPAVPVSSEVLNAALSTVEEAHYRLARLVQPTIANYLRDCLSALRLDHQNPLHDETEITFLEACDSFTGELIAIFQRPGDLTALIGTSCAGLTQAWNKTLAPIVRKSDQSALQSALENGTWDDVVALIQAAALPATRGATRGLIPAPARIVRSSESSEPSGPSRAELQHYATSEIPFLGYPPFATWSARQASQIASRVSFLQSCIVFAIFCLGAYIGYEPSWIGTGKEMMALFLWAFSLDLTAETFKTLLAGKPSLA